MPLELVAPSPALTLNTLLYGPPGTGKTTAACSAPGPVLVLNAEGPNALMYARRVHGNQHIREVAVGPADVLNEALLHLRSDKHDIKTVVVDTLGATFLQVLEDYAKGGKPTLPQYGDTTTALERFARALRDLPVNVVLVAHEHLVTFKDPDGTERLEKVPYTGTNNPALAMKLMAQVDVVGYCGRIDGTEEHPDPRYIAQLIPAGGRHGKDRTAALGEFPDLNITGWLATYQESLKPKPATEEKAA